MTDKKFSDKKIKKINLPGTVPGNERWIPVFCYGEGNTGPSVYLQSGLHGNEHPGLLVCHHLMSELDRLSGSGAIQGKITVVPAANPIGLSQYICGEQAGRFDFYSGTNFNRGFPDLLEAVAQEIKNRLTQCPEQNRTLIRKAGLKRLSKSRLPGEAGEMRRQLMMAAFDADILLDLHSDSQALLHLYTHEACRDQLEELATLMDAPLMLLGADRGAFALDDTVNLFWYDMARRFPGVPVPHGCAAATVELRGRVDVDDELARKDALALVSFFKSMGVLSGDIPVSRGPAPQVSPLTGLVLGHAPLSGLAIFFKKPGERVRKGERIAELVDPLAPDTGTARHPVCSPADGLLFSISLVKFIRAGQVFFKIAADTPQKSEEAGLLTI